MSQLLKPTNPLWIFQRFLGKNKYNWRNEGIQYPGFKYYPRHPDFEDPPYNPSKLFRVQLVKPLKGTPHWERKIIYEFQFTGKVNEVVIVKNIPEVNSRLWRVKHLVKIVPVVFPNGFPKDTNGTFLKENGELVVAHKLRIAESRLLASEEFENDPKKLDGDTLRRESRRRWMTGWNPM